MTLASAETLGRTLDSAWRDCACACATRACAEATEVERLRTRAKACCQLLSTCGGISTGASIASLTSGTEPLGAGAAAGTACWAAGGTLGLPCAAAIPLKLRHRQNRQALGNRIARIDSVPIQTCKGKAIRNGSKAVR